MATGTMTATETVELTPLPPNNATTTLPNSTSGDEAPPAKVGMDNQTRLRIASASFAFFVSGVSDGSIGVILPYLILDYNVTTVVVSSVFGSAFLGWLACLVTNPYLSARFDLGAMLAIGAIIQIVGSVLRTFTTPFPFFVCTFFMLALGQAYQDTHSNTFVAKAKAAHRWLGFIHAMYTGGTLLAPFVATAIATSGDGSRWNLFYIFPVGLGVANLSLVCVAFRDTLRLKKRVQPAPEPETPSTTEDETSVSVSEAQATTMELVKGTLKQKAVWILGIFYFFYLGVMLTASGWVVQYLVDVRGGELAKMGYVPAGFNGGSFLGRLLLPDVTLRFGERRMVFLYCVLALAFQLCFWLIPNIISASIFISLLGFFTGPLFAAGMSVGTKLFPPKYHSTALSLVFVLAQAGGSFFPIVTGVIANSKGVAVLQPILVGLIVATGISWLVVPKAKNSGNPALHHE